jgi:hypothetical protein
MFHPIDTGPFKLVVLRPTDSIKAHPQSRYSQPGRLFDGLGGTSAAFDPNLTFRRLKLSAFGP